MKRAVRRGIRGAILGGMFGLLITVPWEPLLGAKGPVLHMAVPLSLGFALFGAWFASIPCLADTDSARQGPRAQKETIHQQKAA